MSLKGLHVLVTRPIHQAQSLSESVLKKGGEVTLFPTLEIKSTLTEEELTQKWPTLKENADFFIFVSANAVSPIEPFLSNISIPIFAVGPATESALKRAGVQVTKKPETEFSVQGLLKLPELQSILNKKIVIFSGEKSHPVLADILAQRGAKIIVVEVYRRICPEVVNMISLLSQWKKRIQLVIATSSEGLMNFNQLLGEAGRQWLQNIPLLVISESMQQKALQLKLGNPLLKARNATDEAIIEALENWSKHARKPDASA